MEVDNMQVTHFIHQPHINIPVSRNMVVANSEIMSIFQLVSHIDVPIRTNMVVGTIKVSQLIIIHTANEGQLPQWKSVSRDPPGAADAIFVGYI